MNNCLVTKLSEVVDNPDIMSIGEFKIKFRTSTTGAKLSINASVYSRFAFTKTTRLILIGDGTFKKATDQSVDLGKDVTLNAYTDDAKQGVVLYINNPGDFVLRILPCYGVTTSVSDGYLTMGFPGFPQDSIIYEMDGFNSLDFSYLTHIQCTSIKIPAEYLLHSECISFEYTYGGIKEDVSLFGKYVNLRNIQCMDNLEYYGSFESIVEGFAENGFEDGASVSIRFNHNKNITFHGLNGESSLPYKGQIVVTRDGNSFTCKQSDVLKGTYTIGSGWVYTD